MPQLNAGITVALGPYQRGAVLEITAPASDHIVDFPTLSHGGTDVNIAITHVPKTVTLAQGNAYTLTAGNVQITYQIT